MNTLVPVYKQLAIGALFLVGVVSGSHGQKHFQAAIMMTTDSKLDGNTNIIGVHLHSGGAETNGPINIIYCMGDPLPPGDWDNCGQLLSSTRTTNGMFHGNFLATKSWGAWDSGVNMKTSISGATKFHAGAPTTYNTFIQELEGCTSEKCPIYFNWHTSYSYSMNPGAYGLSRAQLAPLSSCPSFVSGSAQCFGTRGEVKSSNTNMVKGITKELPEDAGTAKVLIIVSDTEVMIDENWAEHDHSTVVTVDTAMSDNGETGILGETSAAYLEGGMMCAAVVTSVMTAVSAFI